jgi:hypothetical protein
MVFLHERRRTFVETNGIETGMTTDEIETIEMIEMIGITTETEEVEIGIENYVLGLDAPRKDVGVILLLAYLMMLCEEPAVNIFLGMIGVVLHLKSEC